MRWCPSSAMYTQSGYVVVLSISILNWETARTIHSFYDMKKKQWFAPINSKRVGQPVDINSTRPWTAMPLNLNPLENLLYG